MSKKTNKKQVGAKAKRAKGTAEARAKSAKPKDGMSLGAKVALTVFAVLMALSMMLPSIAAIIEKLKKDAVGKVVVEEWLPDR